MRLPLKNKKEIQCKNYLNLIYIVLGIIRNPEIILSIQEDVCKVICKHDAILHRELKHLWIFMWGPGANLPWIVRDDCIISIFFFNQGFSSLMPSPWRKVHPFPFLLLITLFLSALIASYSLPFFFLV